jgi:hypothetical protein
MMARAAPILRHGARRTTADHTLFVGLDVHKRTIAVATAPATAGTSCTYYGTVANTSDALRRLCKKLATDGTQLLSGQCFREREIDRPVAARPLKWKHHSFRDRISATE